MTEPMQCCSEVWGHTQTQHSFNFRGLCFEWKSFPCWLRLSFLTFMKSYMMSFWQRKKICFNGNLFKQVCVILPITFPLGLQEMFHFFCHWLHPGSWEENLTCAEKSLEKLSYLTVSQLKSFTTDHVILFGSAETLMILYETITAE